MIRRRTASPKPRPPGRPASGEAIPAAERMRRLRARRRAAGLRAVTTWQPRPTQTTRVWSSHRIHDARSLAMHVLIARRLIDDPSILEHARLNLQRWRSQRRSEPAPDWLREWHALLRRPRREVAASITEMTENAARLRQSSPFAGVLSAQERRRIREAFRP